MATIICPRCLLRTTAPLRTSRPLIARKLSSTPSLRSNPQTAVSSSTTSISNPNCTPSPTISTGIAHPLSASQTPSQKPAASSRPKVGPQTAESADSSANATPAIRSSVREGMPLKGLNYFKGKEDPVAMADEEYPAWLWTILDTPKKSAEILGAGKEEEDPRLYAKSANARRAANKRAKAKETANAEFAVHKTPVFEQSVDLPSEGPEGDKARLELQRAMRQKRKGDIKTANFLKGMR